MNIFTKIMSYSIKTKTSFTKMCLTLYMSEKNVKNQFSLINSQTIQKDQKIISNYDTTVVQKRLGITD